METTNQKTDTTANWIFRKICFRSNKSVPESNGTMVRLKFLSHPVGIRHGVSVSFLKFGLNLGIPCPIVPCHLLLVSYRFDR